MKALLSRTHRYLYLRDTPKHAPTTRTSIQDLTIIRAYSWMLVIGILKDLKGKFVSISEVHRITIPLSPWKFHYLPNIVVSVASIKGTIDQLAHPTHSSTDQIITIMTQVSNIIFISTIITRFKSRFKRLLWTSHA